jgi:hypothetical protein
MTKVLRIIISAQLLVASFAEPSLQAGEHQAELIAPRIAVIKKGPRLSRLGHRSVWNDRYERIGTIADFVVGQEYVLFAVIEVGGFLGLGAYQVAVPFRLLAVDEASGRIILPGATRAALENYPRFAFGNE